MTDSVITEEGSIYHQRREHRRAFLSAIGVRRCIWEGRHRQYEGTELHCTSMREMRDAGDDAHSCTNVPYRTITISLQIHFTTFVLSIYNRNM